jgi:hypothetical protein
MGMAIVDVVKSTFAVAIEPEYQNSSDPFNK